MTYAPLRLCRLSLHGPNKEPAEIIFGSGLNVVRGASDTGKSFIVAAIDFMLGKTGSLEQITESEGYDQLLLSFYATSENSHYTLVRGVQGGDYELFVGDHATRPDSEPNKVLKTSLKANPNISHFFLELLGISNKRVMTNKKGKTERLGLRTVLGFCIINETKIQSKITPALGDQKTDDTRRKQALKFLLTGVDDSAVVSEAEQEKSKARTDAQIDLIDEFILETQAEIDEDGRSQEDLRQQTNKLKKSIEEAADAVGLSEAVFRDLRQRRLDLRQRFEINDTRHGEIGSLLARLELLEQHYVSDVDRLNAIAEAGTLYVLSEIDDCPRCGADPEHQVLHRAGEEQAKQTSEAALAEIKKIDVLRRELNQTIESLTHEATQLAGELPLLRENLQEVDAEMQRRSPDLDGQRARYSELLDTKSGLVEAMARFEKISSLEEKKKSLGEDDDPSAGGKAVAPIDSGLTEQTLHKLAKSIQKLLNDWQYPGKPDVTLRQKDIELIIAGKPRSTSGKGVRALLHAAFTIGLHDHLRRLEKPHPGFVVLDSPLLTYAPPEIGQTPDQDDKEMAATDLKTNFFDALVKCSEDTQIIVVENVPVPDTILNRDTTTVFTKDPNSGRYGFIPT